MSSYDRIVFGSNLKYLRSKVNMNQKELADKLNVSQNTVSNWESGNREPDSIELFLKIASIFGVTLDELIKSNLHDFKFTTVEEAMKFIIESPQVAAFGGYDLERMSDEEKIKFANELKDMFMMLSSHYVK